MDIVAIDEKSGLFAFFGARVARGRLPFRSASGLATVEPPTEQNKGDSGGVVQAPRFDLPFDVDRQLLAEEEVLGGESVVR